MSGDVCGGCGHGKHLHGRKGHGSCRFGRSTSGLAGMVNAVKACVIAGVSGDEMDKQIEEARSSTPCECKRFRSRPSVATS